MKTSIVIASLMTSMLAFAAPAAADCTDVAQTGTQLCASIEDPSSRSVGASQTGVGGAGYSYTEFSFFGQTYKSTYAYVYTSEESPVGSNYAAFNEFCMGSGGSCAFQDDSVYYGGAAGYAFIGVSQAGDHRALCYSIGDQFGCQEF